MPVTVDFYYDLASPNAYLAHQATPAISARTGAVFNIIPVLLGGIMKATNNNPPFITYGPVKNKMAYMQMETDRFVRKHGLSAYRFNPHFPMNTLPLMRAATAAKLDGTLPAFLRAGETLMWERGVKLDDPEQFIAGFTQMGLDATALLARTQDPDVKAALIDNTNRAVERGLFGIPTFCLGTELYFGKDKLMELEDDIQAQS